MSKPHSPNEDDLVSILREIRPEVDFASAENFFARGMLDSFDLTNLVAALEDRFAIVIDGAEIVPENFRSLAAMRSMLVRHGVLSASEQSAAR